MAPVATGSRKRKNAPGKEKIEKKQKQSEIVFSSTIEMPAPLRERIAEIGGYDIQIVTQKRLEYTDLSRNHGRLSIPTMKLINDFATEEEKQLLDSQDERSKEQKRNEG